MSVTNRDAPHPDQIPSTQASHSTPLSPQQLLLEIDRVKDVVSLSSTGISHQIYRRSLGSGVTQVHILKELDALKAKVASLNPTNDDASIEDSEQVAETPASTTEELGRLGKELDILKQQRRDWTEDAERRIDVAVEEKEDVLKQLHDLQQSCVAQKTKSNDHEALTRDKISALEQSLASSNRIVSSLEERKATLLAELQASHQHRDEATNCENATKSKLADLAGRLAASTIDLKALQDQYRESAKANESFKSDLKQKDEELCDLRDKLTTSNDHNESTAAAHEGKIEYHRIEAVKTSERADGAEKRLESLERQHVQKVNNLKREHEMTLRQRDQDMERMRTNHERQVATLEKAHASTLHELERRHESDLDALQKSHAAGIAKIRDEHESAIEQLRTRHDQVLRRKDDQITSTQLADEKALERRLAGMKEDHDTQMTRLREAHQKEISCLKAGHEQALLVAGDHSKIVAHAIAKAENVAEERRRATQCENAAVVANMHQDHEIEIDRLKAAHDQALEAAKSRSAAGQDVLSAEKDEDHKRTIVWLQDEHTSILAKLQSEHAATVNNMASQHQQALERARNHAIADFQAMVRDKLTIESQHQERLTKMSKHHKILIDNVNAAHDTAIQEQKAQSVAKETAMKQEIADLQQSYRLRLASLQHAHQTHKNEQEVLWQRQSDQTESVREQLDDQSSSMHELRQRQAVRLQSVESEPPCSLQEDETRLTTFSAEADALHEDVKAAERPRTSMQSEHHEAMTISLASAPSNKSFEDYLSQAQTELSDLGRAISANEAAFAQKIKQHVGDLQMAKDQLAAEYKQKSEELVKQKRDLDSLATSRHFGELEAARIDLRAQFAGSIRQDSTNKVLYDDTRMTPTRLQAFHNADRRLVAEHHTRLAEKKSQIASNHVAHFENLNDEFDAEISSLLENKDRISADLSIGPSEFEQINKEMQQKSAMLEQSHQRRVSLASSHGDWSRETNARVFSASVKTSPVPQRQVDSPRTSEIWTSYDEAKRNKSQDLSIEPSDFEGSVATGSRDQSRRGSVAFEVSVPPRRSSLALAQKTSAHGSQDVWARTAEPLQFRHQRHASGRV